MSWSITLIGKPEDISNALDEKNTKLDAQSKLEFDDALPHMKALLLQNFDKRPGVGYTSPQIMKLTASGSGYTVDGEQRQRSFSANIETLYGQFVSYQK